MNKFKLSLFAVIAAGVVGCGGGGGGGTGTTSYAPGEVVVDDGIDRFPYVAREAYFEAKTDDVDFADTVQTLWAENVDLNDDGFIDIVKFRTKSSYKNLYVEAFMNNGDRTFTRDESIFAAVGNNFNPMHQGSVGDINADGKPDFVNGEAGCFDDHGGDPCMPPLMSQPDGTYKVTTHPLLVKLTGGPSHVVDMDNDGDLDVVYYDIVVNGDWNKRIVINVYENRSENGVAKFVAHNDVLGSPVNTHGKFSVMHFFDLDGDGRKDMFFHGQEWDYNRERFSDAKRIPGFAYNRGNFRFEKSADIWLGEPLQAWTIFRGQVADLDGDGDMDMYAPDSGTDQWTSEGTEGGLDKILWNVGGKLFVETPFADEGFNHNTDFADVNGDGHLDIITAGNGTKESDARCIELEPEIALTGQVFKVLTQVKLNDGNGGFTIGQEFCQKGFTFKDEASQRLGLPGNLYYLAATIQFADYDNDGQVDYFQGNAKGSGDFILWNNKGLYRYAHEFYAFHGYVKEDLEWKPVEQYGAGTEPADPLNK